MRTTANSVEEYLAALPEDRRAVVSAVRKIILANLDADYEEGIQYGMIGYYVPHRVHPAGYHCDPKQPLPLAALGSQKNYLSLHLMPIYVSAGCEPGSSAGKLAQWFKSAWQKSGKKLDMGKACIRFKSIEDVPLEVVGEAIRRVPAQKWIDTCKATVASRKSKKEPKKREPRTK
jgi:hypothetical protein